MICLNQEDWLLTGWRRKNTWGWMIVLHFLLLAHRTMNSTAHSEDHVKSKHPAAAYRSFNNVHKVISQLSGVSPPPPPRIHCFSLYGLWMETVEAASVEGEALCCGRNVVRPVRLLLSSLWDSTVPPAAPVLLSVTIRAQFSEHWSADWSAHLGWGAAFLLMGTARVDLQCVKGWISFPQAGQLL